MAEGTRQRFAGGRVPDPGRPILAGRCDPPAVRAVDRPEDAAAMLEGHTQRLAARQVPLPRLVLGEAGIGRRRQEGPAVGPEGHATDGRAMRQGRQDAQALVHAPDPRHPVARGRGEPPPIRAEGQRRHPRAVHERVRRGASRGDVPDAARPSAEAVASRVPSGLKQRSRTGPSCVSE